MEQHEPLLRVLRRGYSVFRGRRLLEVVGLAAAVALPALLAAVAIGLVLGPGRASAWIVPIIAAAGLIAGLIRGARHGVAHHMSFGAFVLAVEAGAGLARNELVNALQLGRASSSMSDPLAREIAAEVLRRGAESAGAIRFRDLAPSRRMRMPFLQSGGSLAVLGVLLAVAPGDVMRAAGGILHPGRVDESSLGRIIVDPGDCTAQRGAAVPVRVRLVGLEGEPVLFHRAGGSAWERETMRGDSSGFAAVLADLQAPTEYAAAAGGLRSRTYRISVEEPLRATGYEKRTRFPAYTGLAPEKELSPNASIAALAGSEVELRVHMSRPDGRGRIVFESGDAIPLTPADPSVATATMQVRREGVFRVELESPEVRGARWRSEPFRCDPIPDRSPSIYLVSPGEQTDIPPEMAVSVVVDCADDFGITRCDLVSRRNDGPQQRATIGRWANEREARIEYPWDLEGIALTPGDRISYHFELTDNDAITGPKTTVSPEYTLRFPTVEQMYADQTQERTEGIEDLRESLDKQIELRQEMDKILRDVRSESGVQWEQKQEVEDVLKKQQEILDKMESMTAGIDKQIQRIEQGQLFSPEIVSKIAQIQNLMQQIQSPEFHRMMDELRKAMQSLDPQAVKKALEQMKLTQKDLEQGLDRTLKMLERLLAEEKLDEMIQRAKRLQEQQDRINQDLAQNQKTGQSPDSTSSLSPEEREKLEAAQEAARKEMEELKKSLQELQEMAKRSHQQMADKLASNEGQQARQDLQQSSDEMQSGKQCMGKNNRGGALKSGRKTSKGLQSFSQRMAQMQAEMQQSMTEEMSRKILGLAGDLIELSRKQEEANARSTRENTREMALEQDRIARATAAVVDQLFELARQTPFISPGQARTLGDALTSLAKATDSYESGQRAAAVVLGTRAGSMLDAAVASLLESNQNMCNSASSSCNKPNPLSQMQGLSSQQQGLNQQSQEALGEMQGERLQQEGGQGRLERLAAQQMQIRAGLMDLSQSMGDQQNMLGRLNDLAKEMQDVAKEMKDRHLDERIIQRQEKILSRLLTAQRSLRRQDFEEQRRSRTGVDPANPVSPAAVRTGLSQREEIRRGILKGTQDPIPADFRRIVEEYFKALTGEDEGK